MKSKIEKIIKGYVNKVWKDNDDNLGFRVRDDNKVEEIERLEFTKKELLKYSTLLIDYLNSQSQPEDGVVLKKCCPKCGSTWTVGGREGEVEMGTYCVGCGTRRNSQDKEVSAVDKNPPQPNDIYRGAGNLVERVKDTPEEWEEKAKEFDKIHDILKPYHKEAEDYSDTLKRVLDDREREVYVDGYKDGITRCMESLDNLLNSKKK